MEKRKNSSTCSSYIPLIFLLGLIFLLYGVFLAAVIPGLIGLAPEVNEINRFYTYSGYVNLGVFHFFFILAMTCFVLTSITDPGSVPSLFPWDPDCLIPMEADHADFRGVERKADGRPRFCRICALYKPDRTHHSRHTGACVLEMDHYCPWVHNCIGYKNKKYFFLLVIYSAAALICYCVTLGPYLVGRLAPKQRFSVLDLLVVFCVLMAGLFALVLVCFGSFHTWLMINNYTTIEFCEKRKADHGKRTVQGEKLRDVYRKSPYDMGGYSNLKHFLGPYPLLWLIPTRCGYDHSAIAGCVFKVNEKHPLFRREHKILLRRSDSLRDNEPNEDQQSRAGLLS